MSGLQVFSSNGSVRLSTDDYLHRQVAQGAVALPGFGAQVFVSVPGMTPTDDWFICCVNFAICWAVNGGFYIKNIDQFYPASYVVYYSIHRR